MIERVSFEKTTFERLPFKFEAGTPDYVATVGLAKALDYVSGIGMEQIHDHESALTHYCMEQLRHMGINKVSLIAFRSNNAGNAFWKTIGWTCSDGNVYEFVLNKKNITRFIKGGE